MSTTTLFTILAWLLAAAGALLFAWAMLWDRAARRGFRRRAARLRRCPRCWYDMAAIDGLRCPECGRDAKNENKLLKTRRKWRWAAAAALLALASYPAFHINRIQAEGWTGAVPTAAIILAAPWLEMPQGAALRVPRGAAPLSLGETLMRMLHERQRAEEGLTVVDRSLLAWRIRSGDSDRPVGSRQWAQQYLPLARSAKFTHAQRKALGAKFAGASIRTRPVWIEGEPGFLSIRPFQHLPEPWLLRITPVSPQGEEVASSHFGNQQSTVGEQFADWMLQYHLRLPPMERAADRIALHAALETHPTRVEPPFVLWEGDIELPVTTTASPEAGLPGAPWPEMEEYCRSLVPILIHARDRGGGFRTFRAPEKPPVAFPVAKPEGMCCALRIEACLDGRTLARGTIIVPSDEPAWPMDYHLGDWPLTPVEHHFEYEPPPGDTWTIRIRTDRALSLFDVDAKTAWQFELEFPVAVHNSRGEVIHPLPEAGDGGAEGAAR